MKAYEQIFQKVQNTLDIKVSQDIGSIAIKLGVEDLISPAQNLLKKFKVKTYAWNVFGSLVRINCVFCALQSTYRQHTQRTHNAPDFSRPAYNVAALFLSSETAKVSGPTFDTVCMQQCLPSLRFQETAGKKQVA